jgi:TrmH family RNA methyltransferase
MDFTEPISQNLKKFVKSLQSRKERQASNMFVVEGEKLCEELLGSNLNIEFLVLRGSAGDQAHEIAVKFNERNITVYVARSKQFDQICNTKSPQDILAVVRSKEQEADYTIPFIALDGVNDPGNLGTIIRTADWFGFRHIILGGKTVDKYNAKTVRASMGSLFRIQVSVTDNLSDFLRENHKGFDLFAATLSAGKAMETIRPTGKFGIIFGSEAHGISGEVLNLVSDEFLIEGRGDAESLNVAVSLGIAAYYFSQFL